METNRAIVNGSHSTVDLQNHLCKYIENFVLCKNCHLPETYYKIKHGIISQKCNACGAVDPVDMTHKLTTFILSQYKKAKELAAKTEKKDKKDKKKDDNEASANAESGTKSEKSEKSSKKDKKDKDKSSADDSEKKVKKSKKKSSETTTEDSATASAVASTGDDDGEDETDAKVVGKYSLMIDYLNMKMKDIGDINIEIY